MTFSKGSLILVDYTARIKDTGKVIDTTIQEEAKTHSIYDKTIIYTPKLVSINELSYPVLEGLGEALANMSVNDKLTVEVAPAKAFGERDSNKIRTMPLRKLGEDAEKVSVGDTIEIDNKTGTVRLIGSGRVQIDYNHKHAGKTILYDVSIIKSLETDHDKIQGILKYHLAMEDDEFSFDLTDNKVTIPVPNELQNTDQAQPIKHFIQMNIFKFVPIMKEIDFVETWVNKRIVNTQPTEENWVNKQLVNTHTDDTHTDHAHTDDTQPKYPS